VGLIRSTTSEIDRFCSVRLFQIKKPPKDDRLKTTYLSEEADVLELTAELKAMYRETAKAHKGSQRRVFMARIVRLFGYGGQSWAARELGWCRNTLRKGIHQLDSGIAIEDNFSARGRKKAEEKQPNLLIDIQSLVDGQSQADPTFQTTGLYTRQSASEVRKQLIIQKDYLDEELPSEETIRVKLNTLGYKLRAVQKSRPQKNS
jgi:Rhodopirellula transposase DDE domain